MFFIFVVTSDFDFYFIYLVFLLFFFFFFFFFNKPQFQSSTQRTTHTFTQILTLKMSTDTKTADPYKEKARETEASKDKQVQELYGIVDALKTSMLTTRRSDGTLTSRAMNPVRRSGPDFTYFTNIHGDKIPEIENDSHVNVAYVDPSSTNWVSISGTARISQDREKIKQLYNPSIKAWFGDLGDGVNDGSENDPRIALIEVKTKTVNYWYSVGKLGTLANVLVSTVTGEAASPGSLRELNEADIERARIFTL
eukprot:TRINITY_DN9407_c0_g1_i3.p1 TRINITY_DN9407_c0_g1~~TRINITY_DN9407_c0_g1_i3.p1  ORF type:complete len:253 (+),score=52.86 TRINITY_DN9407_c0_g1_i3:53-811(+)